MAETVRIEIPIETVDNTDPELSKVTQNLNKMKDAADKANSSTKKPEKRYQSSTSQHRKRRNRLRHGRKRSTKCFWKPKTRFLRCYKPLVQA